jgi:hypothetical protein
MGAKIKAGLAYRRVAGELFVVDSAKARLHELNGPAAVIWEGLAKGRSAAAIAADLREEFEVDAVTAAGDVKFFMAELEAAGLLEGKI